MSTRGRPQPSASCVQSAPSSRCLLYTLEIAQAEPNFAGLVSGVLDKIRRVEDGDTLASDKEFVVHQGTVCVGRYEPFSVTDELRERSNRSSQENGQDSRNSQARYARIAVLAGPRFCLRTSRPTRSNWRREPWA